MAAAPAAQEGDLDPDSPMADIPDFGVAWPDAGERLEPLAELPPLTPEVVAETGLDTIQDVEVPGDGGTALAEEDQAQTDAEQMASIEGDRRYELDLSGFDAVANRRFVERFDGLSVLRQGEGSSANAAQISRRMVEDRALLETMLRNAGYYDSIVLSSISPRADGTLSVRFSAILGTRYTYDSINLHGIEIAPSDEQARMRMLYGLQPGMPVVADSLVKAKTLLSAELLETGYPFVEVGQETVTIDHDTEKGRLDQPVSPGQRLRFGQIIANDDGLLGARHMQRIARFAPGEYYRQSQVEDLRNALIATGLVSTVTVQPQPSSDGTTTDIAVNIEPAPLRTISAELGYDTGNGLRLEAGWQHRNFFRPEGALILRGVLGTREQLASATLRRNNWRRRDLVASLQLLASNSDVPAFEARTLMLQARVERASTLLYQKKWNWYGEAEIIGTDEKSFSPADNATVNRRFAIASIGGYVQYDRSNDLLDPTRGFRLSALIRPEVSFQDTVFTYVRTQLDASGYWPVGDKAVIAARTRIGFIAGASRDQIAPSRRFYAGGGSSVRGYGYQAVGPRYIDNSGDSKPLGGTGLFEMAVEARVKLFGAFSVVPFVDAGTLSNDVLPDGDTLRDIRVGAGIGVRYASNFGPIRIDVGTPINPQPGDSRIGVYVSLGQAF